MKDKYFNIIAIVIIITSFFIAGLVQAHETVVVEVNKTNRALAYACHGFVNSLVEDGKVDVADVQKSIQTCVNLIAERMDAKPHQHDHG